MQQHSGPAAAAKVQEAVTRITGYDKTSVELTAQQVAARNRRLDGNVRSPLYHQTAAEGCRGIIQSNEMRIGQAGIAGGGIYFAVCADDTMHKAHWHGYMLTLRVRLGNVEKWGPNDRDRSLTFAQLQARGVDTVHIPRPGGDEFIVYHSDQVELTNAQLVQLPAHYPVGTEAAGFFKHPTQCPLTGPVLSCQALRRNSAAMQAFVDRRDADAAQRLLHGDSGHAARAASAGNAGGACGVAGPRAGKPVCQYAPRCYRQNLEHWKNEDHPSQRGPVTRPK